jgi:hypothetical protein
LQSILVFRTYSSLTALEMLEQSMASQLPLIEAKSYDFVNVADIKKGETVCNLDKKSIGK